MIEAGLIQIVRAMIWAGQNICGQPVDPMTDIQVSWDDSYITDAETRRRQMKEDVLDNVIPKWLYVSKYYNLSPEESRALVAETASQAADIPVLKFPEE